MRIVFAGTPEAAVPTLDALLGSRHEVAAVLTRPEAPTGRGRRLRPSPVAEHAAAHGVEVLTPPSPSDPEFLERLRGIDPACCPIVAYGAMLRRESLDVPEFGWVNLHFSVLPAWRGAAPVQRAIMAGDEVTGATVFSVVEALDEGPVLGTITERIRDDDTAGTLLDRLAREGAGLMVEALDHIEAGDIAAHPQPEDGISYAAKLTTDDARVDWNRPAFAVDRHVRGCTPTPGAWTSVDDQRLNLGPVRIAEEATLGVGELDIGKREVRVGTATTDVVLGDVQPFGRKRMPAADWGRGVSLPTGTVFT
ncbi:methionyl-tRNA formyltransferase [Aeromicrobium sp.]|uniref:methionyl-tRNA formyltransferase n=1 Tax=Aeromicrobium sp. TaxID=1871063 RepID=UPI003D6C5E18